MGKLTVNADTCSIIYNDKKLEQLRLEGKTMERKAVGVVIYSESDFDAFYDKHCARAPNDNNPFTVLVTDGTSIPTRQETRTLFEETLKRGTTRFEKDWLSHNGKIITRVEHAGLFSKPRHAVRTYFQGSFQDEPRQGNFRCRDVREIFPRQLMDIFAGGHISQLELQNLQNIWKFAFSPRCEYAISYIWAIGHTDAI